MEQKEEKLETAEDSGLGVSFAETSFEAGTSNGNSMLEIILAKFADLSRKMDENSKEVRADLSGKMEENSKEIRNDLTGEIKNFKKEVSIKFDSFNQLCSQNKLDLENSISKLENDVDLKFDKIDNEISNVKSEILFCNEKINNTDKKINSFEIDIKQLKIQSNNMPELTYSTKTDFDCKNVIYSNYFTHSLQEIPMFENNLNQYHPVKFIEDLETLFNKYNIPDSLKLETALNKLNKEITQYFEIGREKIKSFKEFKDWIIDQFWNNSIQNQIRRNFFINNNRGYCSGKLTKHVLNWFGQTKYLKPKYDDKDFIEIIIHHFPPNICIFLQTNCDSINNFIEQCKKLDSYNINTTNKKEIITDINKQTFRNFENNNYHNSNRNFQNYNYNDNNTHRNNRTRGNFRNNYERNDSRNYNENSNFNPRSFNQRTNYYESKNNSNNDKNPHINDSNFSKTNFKIKFLEDASLCTTNTPQSSIKNVNFMKIDEIKNDPKNNISEKTQVDIIPTEKISKLNSSEFGQLPTNSVRNCKNVQSNQDIELYDTFIATMLNSHPLYNLKYDNNFSKNNKSTLNSLPVVNSLLHEIKCKTLIDTGSKVSTINKIPDNKLKISCIENNLRSVLISPTKKVQIVTPMVRENKPFVTQNSTVDEKIEKARERFKQRILKNKNLLSKRHNSNKSRKNNFVSHKVQCIPSAKRKIKSKLFILHEGPYRIKEIETDNAYILEHPKNKIVKGTYNTIHLKHYYCNEDKI